MTIERRPARVVWAIKQLGLGGAERLLLTLARRYDRSQFSIRAVFLMAENDELADALVAAGVAVECFNARRSSDPRWMWRLRRLIASEEVDILHVHSPLVAGVARIASRTTARPTRPRLVVTEHGGLDHYHPMTRLLDIVTLTADDATIAVSEQVRRTMPRWTRPRVEVLTPCVDVDELTRLRSTRAEVRSSLDVADDEVLAITVANLRPVKDYPSLLEAVAILVSRGVAVRFIAVGGGELEVPLRRMAHERGLDDRFKFLGFRHDAQQLIAASDLFVLASTNEGLSISVLEALALGVPIVARAVGGIPEAVRTGVDGLLVPRGNALLLAEAIEKLAIDHSLRQRMAHSAEQRGRDFDVGRAVQRLETTYNRLLVGD